MSPLLDYRAGVQMRPTCFIFLLITICSSFAHATAPNNESTIEGRLQVDEGCGTGSHQVWVSQGTTLIYQARLPEAGTFRFHLVPGSYKVSSTSATGCYGELSVETKLNQSTSADLRLLKKKRTPAQINDLGRSGCVCFRLPCPCESMNFQVPNYILPPYPPWIYSANRYRNFFYPGPWNIWGIQPQPFPGTGTMMAYKPILYVDGPKGQSVDVRVNYPDKRSNWLATIPQYSEENGWKVQIPKDGQGLKVGDATYEHLFYDFRFFPTGFQNTKGFCKPRNEAISEMARLLEEMKFKQTEIAHFLEEWRIKMPKQNVCVYPQGNKELEAVATITTEPSVELATRVLFVVLIEDSLPLVKSTQFTSRPTESWIPEKSKLNAGPRPRPQLREWSVSFHVASASAGK
jgi:hypothetical protein